jgi:hypothetical protein
VAAEGWAGDGAGHRLEVWKMEGGSMKSTAQFVICLILGGLVGSLMGEIAGQFTASGPLRTVLTTSISFGLTPGLSVDLGFLFFSIGLGMNINVLTVLGFLLGIVLYKRFLQAS